MLGRHHILVGCAGLLAAQSLTAGTTHQFIHDTYHSHWDVPVPASVVLLTCSAFGALLPDLDHRHSLLNMPFRDRLFPSPARLLHHRGATHSLLAWVLLSSPVVVLDPFTPLYAMLLATSLGYVLHLLADSLTTAGIPALWPLYTRSIGIPPIRRLRFSTGSAREYMLVGAILGGTVVLLWHNGWPLS